MGMLMPVLMGIMNSYNHFIEACSLQMASKYRSTNLASHISTEGPSTKDDELTNSLQQGTGEIYCQTDTGHFLKRCVHHHLIFSFNV